MASISLGDIYQYWKIVHTGSQAVDVQSRVRNYLIYSARNAEHMQLLMKCCTSPLLLLKGATYNCYSSSWPRQKFIQTRVAGLYIYISVQKPYFLLLPSKMVFFPLPLLPSKMIFFPLKRYAKIILRALFLALCPFCFLFYHVNFNSPFSSVFSPFSVTFSSFFSSTFSYFSP